ncbi:hypothetical protein [Vibrio anguillarum]|uniref:hypothetical protein n=1 Tax=Vibrio anguillarum TaxID=55601 RepID=UPI000BB520CE|nr:hypothetical protein [Vibrio anguillarum]ATC60267.1 hypothetical protein CMV05_23035 [Vibrio anguillarum]
MERKLPIDESTMLEGETGLPLLTKSELKESVWRSCWGSLLSSSDKRLKYRSKEKAIRGYVTDFGGTFEGYYLFNPDGEYPVFDIINAAVCQFASKVSMGITYNTQEETNESVLICHFEPSVWRTIPESHAQEMLEEIETKLRRAAVSIVHFSDFSHSSAILRTFAMSLVTHHNIGVFLSTTVRLTSDLPEIESLFTKEPSLQSMVHSCLLSPSEKLATSHSVPGQ